MIIAVSGAHSTGKTTLAEELADRLQGYEIVEEPYWQLFEEGRVFAQPPSFEDFEVQLERSIGSILESEGDLIFDRCPLDLLAYLIVHPDRLLFDPESRIEDVSDAMVRIDLIVFVPVEEPDRIADADRRSLRRLIDEELRELVMEDRLDLGVYAIEVVGSVEERANRVLASLERNSISD